MADRLLTSANVRDRFERLLSVEDAGAWKPSPVAYGTPPQSSASPSRRWLLVAVHPWDVDGARRAGLQTVWVNRSGGPFPATFTEPTYTVTGVDEIVELWCLTACDLMHKGGRQAVWSGCDGPSGAVLH